ncbi:MAG: ChbG/HpnK family deacetylase, partial [Deltaproteobacteria bacterium]|nr:ChbG/HpnK family deacetylase [Deltaproteobacteria bacterium]
MYCLPLADDCGISASNVEAIALCLDAGALRGASIMASGDAAAKAAEDLGRRLAANPTLRAGAHLNLLEGRCTADPKSIPLLADGSGFFRHSLGTLCRTLYTMRNRDKHILIHQVSLEWHAQIDAIHTALKTATGWDTVPLYLDGHQHVHAIPALRPALGDVLGSVPVIHVRVPEEPRYRCPAPPVLFAAGTLRRELLAFWGRSLRKFLSRRRVPAPDYFIGAFCSGNMTLERLAAGLAAIAGRGPDDAVVEIMTHPGVAPRHLTPVGASRKEAVFARFYAAPERETERRML